MRYHFIVNPIAGRGSPLPMLDAVAGGLRAQGIECTRYVTAKAGDAAAHVATLEADETDRLVVVGGDGTLREVVNGRAPPLPWPVALIPRGTANLVARELRVPLKGTVRAYVNALVRAEPWPVDLLHITHDGAPPHLAVATIGAGLDAEIVRSVAMLRSSAAGAGGYVHWVRPIWDTLRRFRFPRLRVTVDGRITYAAAACIVQNARCYGGLFRLSPQAALDSGKLDVTLIRARTHRDLFRVLCGAWLRRAHRFRDVKVARGSRLRLAADTPVGLQVDGDPGGTTTIEVELVPEALTLLKA